MPPACKFVKKETPAQMFSSKFFKSTCFVEKLSFKHCKVDVLATNFKLRLFCRNWENPVVTERFENL